MATTKRNVANVEKENEYYSIDSDEWKDLFPAATRTSKKQDTTYDELLNRVADGQFMVVPVEDESKVRSVRTKITRRATSLGMNSKNLEYRYNNYKHLLGVQLVEKVPGRRGRPSTKK